jgi:hypothetical protein
MEAMMKTLNGVLVLILISVQLSAADVLVRMDRVKIRGKLSAIADTYVEFVEEKSPGQEEWIKVDKKKILVILNSRGKLIYPRDKYDEIALNYGKVKLRTAQDVLKYKQRKTENSTVQSNQEQTEKNRFKIAAVIGGVGGLMAWAFIQGK